MVNIRARIDTGFENFGRIVIRNRLKTLLIMVLLTAGLISQLPKTTVDNSNEGFFREGDTTLADYNAFLEQFGREDLILIGIGPANVFDRSFLKKLAKLHETLEEELPYLKDVTSLVNVRDTRGEGDRLIVEDLLKDIPETPEALARLKKRVLSSSLYPNFLISEDGRFATVLIETISFSPGKTDEDLLAGFAESAQKAPAAEAGKRKMLTPEERNKVVETVKAVMARFESADFPLHLAGGPVMEAFFEEAMARDMGLFIGLAVLVIGILLLVLFGRFAGAVLPILIVVFSLLATFGIMAASGAPFTVLTTMLPSFLLAVGVGASVHLLAIFFRHYGQHGEKEVAIVYALGHSGLPIFMTGLTTSAGLFAFSTADMPPIADIGIFAGIGVLIGLAYTLVLMPALLAVWPIRRYPRFAGKDHVAFMDRLLTGIADFATTWPRSILFGFVVIVAVSLIGLGGLRFSMNMIALMPESLELRKSVELLDQEMKGTTALEVVIETGRENGLYEPTLMNNIEALGRFAENYRNEKGEHFVGNTSSVLNVLKETHMALNENRAEFYAIPQRRKLIAQELLLFENSSSDDLEEMVDSRFSMARLSLSVPNEDAAFYVGFVGDIRQEADRLIGKDGKVTVTGALNLFTQMIDAMMRSMVRTYLIAGVVITLMMMLLIGSFRLGLISMVVNLSPILITMGLVMGLLDIPLDFFNLMLGSIALGLAVDDTIHFFHNFRRYYGEFQDVAEAVRQTLLGTGRAMMFTTLVLVTGFLLFLFATLNNAFYFGLLIGLALIFALAADFLLAPALLVLVTRTGYGRELTERWCGVKAPSGA